MLLSLSTLLRLLAVLYGSCPVLHMVSAPGVPQKPGTKSCDCFLCLLHWSGSGSQELDGRAHSPRVWRAFCPLHPQPQSPPVLVGCLRPVSRCDPPGWMSTIQNLRRSLIRNWRPVCRAVGAVVLGAEPAPFPSPLPPASAGLGRTCELFSGLARSLCSANGRQCVRAGYFLSLFCSPTI